MSSLEWDLSELVKDKDPERIIGDLEEMVKGSAVFSERYRGKVESLNAVGLEQLLKDKDEFVLDHEGPVQYIHLLYASDTSDPLANRLHSAARKAGTRADQNMAFLDIELGRSLRSHPELLEEKGLIAYRHYLERVARAAPYQLTESEEQLVMAKDQSGIYSWSKLQSRWLSTRSFRMVVEGVERSLSIGEMVPFFYDPDREVRKRAYIAIGEALGKDEVIWTEAITAICNDHLQMCEVRGYPTPMESSFMSNDVDQAAIEALIRTVERNSGLCQRYFLLKARLLGLERMFNYDLRASLPDSTDRRYSWDQSRELMLSIYGEFDEEFGGYVEDMFRRNHLDGKVRPGKRVGAFCSTDLKGRSAYILQSFNGRINDVYTQAHELGHAVHAYLCTNVQVPSNCSVSLCIAECGSLFGELLLTDRLLGEVADKDEMRAILTKVLDGFSVSVFQEGSRYFFEKSLYQALEDGSNLDGQRISDLYLAGYRRMYGDTVEWLPESRWDWARFPHHFFADSRFYNYPYVFAQLFVFALYRLYKEQGKDFVPKMKGLLMAGSSRSPSQLALELGFDISKDEFWQKGLDQAAEFVDRLESTLDQ